MVAEKMEYVLKLVSPDRKKFEIRHHNKRHLEDARKAALDLGYLRATIHKLKKN